MLRPARRLVMLYMIEEECVSMRTVVRWQRRNSHSRCSSQGGLSAYGWWGEDAESWGMCLPQMASNPSLPLWRPRLSNARSS